LLLQTEKLENRTGPENITMSTVPIEHEWHASQWDWPLQNHDGVVQVKDTSDNFEVGLEVKYFTPSDVEVRVLGNELHVDCRHETREDAHGTVTREVHRVYHLPPNIDVNSVKCRMSARGTLHITAQKSH